MFLYDLILLSETWLKPHIKFDLKNFNIIRKDRTTTPTGSGLAICISKKLQYSVTNNIFSVDDSLDTMAILLNTSHGKILIVNIYKHPTFRLTEQHIKQIVNKAKQQNSSILIGGDFNSHHTSWGCGKNCRSVTNLFEAAFENDLIILNDGSPTHINNPDQQNSAIDLTVTSANFALLCTWSVLPDALNSDHYPIVTKIGTSGEKYKHFSHKLSTKGVIWEDFYNYLNNEVKNITKLYPDALATYDKLVHTIIEGINTSQTSTIRSNP